MAASCSTHSINHRGDKRSNNFAIDESFIKMPNNLLQRLIDEGNGLAICHVGNKREGLKELSQKFSVDYTAQYLNQLGTCHLLNNDLYKAMFYYRVALGKKSNSPEIYNNLGILNARLGHHSQALKYLQRAKTASPTSTTPRYNLASIYIKHGQYNNALKELRVLYNRSKEDMDIISTMGTAYLLKGNTKLALHYFNKITIERAKWADVAYYKAQLLLLKGKDNEAKKMILNAKDIYRDDLNELKETLMNTIEKKGNS